MAGCFAAAARGQAPIRAETRLVLVDTVVTDKKGNYVDSLTKDDFKVYEDNKEQPIASFSIESTAPNRSYKHYVVLFFDNSTAGLSDQTYARQAATKFIDAYAAPDRLMAIAQFGGTLRVNQNFTADAARLTHAVAGLKFASVGSASGGFGGGRAMAAVFNDVSIRGVLAALRTTAKGLSALAGRKTLIFLSGGFPMTNETRTQLTATVEACNLADVAVYPIDVHGLLTPTPVASMSGEQTREPGRKNLRNMEPPVDTSIAGLQYPLFVLAEGTGGRLIANSNDLPGGLEKIAKEQSEYYSVGFTPAREANPGACHALRVKVVRSGMTVRARTGYCESKTLEILSGTPAERDLEARMTANAMPNVTGASMRTPFFYNDAKTARVNLVIDMPGDAIHFVENSGRFRAIVNVLGIASLPDGTLAARFTDSVNLSFEEKKEVEAFSRSPYHYEKQFEIPPGSYGLRVVFSSASNQLGRLDSLLTIEPWRADEFALSSLALSKTVHPAKDPAADFSSELLENRVPLLVGNVQFVPTGSSRFKKSEASFVYAEVYEPAKARVTVRMELLDSSTGKVELDFGTADVQPSATGSPVMPIGLMVPARELSAGIYRLRITATDSTGHSAVRSTGFQLEN
jgi:VWFA-related protein